MRCPFCHDLENRVVDSRLGKEGDAIRRRRHCEHCGRRFTTYERVEESLPMVVKKDGRREPFERAKIVNGLKRACEKRPVPVDTIEALVDGVERQLQESSERVVTSRALGETVMRELHALDAVAYVRFASVYRSFRAVPARRTPRSRPCAPPADGCAAPRSTSPSSRARTTGARRPARTRSSASGSGASSWPWSIPTPACAAAASRSSGARASRSWSG